MAAIGIIFVIIGVVGGFGFSTLETIGLLLLAGALYLFISDKDKSDGKINVPSEINNYKKNSYITVEAMLKNAGFTNIQCVPLNDLTRGVLKKPGFVESVIIDGKKVTSGGQKFLPDANVVISYHSLAK